MRKIELTKEEKKYFEEIKEFDRVLEELLKITPLGFPKPINLQEEKNKFLHEIDKGNVYNPQIIYEDSKHNLDSLDTINENISKLDFSEDLFGIKKLYKEKFNSRIIQIGYHKNWGNQKSCEFSLKYWGKPSLFTVLKAKRFCKKYVRDKIVKSEISPMEVGNELSQEVLKLVGHCPKIKLVSMGAKVNIEPSLNLIEINKDERFTRLDIERLKVHEIGVHYTRYYNASKFNFKLLEIGTVGYLATEEGIAAYNEFSNGVMSKAQLFVYAGRVLASHFSLKKSFYDIFKILKNYGFTDKVAFAITFRAKRNLSDTSLPGGFMKDYVYFEGFYKVKRFAEKNDINRLFIGKISIDNLKIISKFVNRFYEYIEGPFKK